MVSVYVRARLSVCAFTFRGGPGGSQAKRAALRRPSLSHASKASDPDLSNRERSGRSTQQRAKARQRRRVANQAAGEKAGQEKTGILK